MVTLPNGEHLTEVTRQSCLDRLYAIPLGVIPYSNSVISPVTGRRADCTGLVSEVWGTPEQGEGIWLKAYSTYSFYGEQVIRRIDWSELRPGDSIGYYIPTAGDPTPRHAAIWLGGDKKLNGQYHIRDHGSGMGPKDRWVGAPWTGWLHPDRLAPWRYVAMIEGDDMPLTPAEITAIADAVWAKKLSGPGLTYSAGGLQLDTFNSVTFGTHNTGTLKDAFAALPAAVVAALPEGGSFTEQQKADIVAAVVVAITAHLAPKP